MACNPMTPLGCIASGVGQAAGDAATTVIGNSFAEAMRDGATWMIKTTMGWWIEVPAIDLNASPVLAIRGYVAWLTLVVAVVGVMWQAVLMMLSRRPEPLFNIGRGLFYLALWTSIGVIGPAAALRAGDSFSSWVLDEAAGGQATDRIVRLASLEPVSSAGAVILLGLLMMCAGLVQAILMLFREAAVVILAGVVVLAAAGSFNAATRPWLPKVVGWMLALITYKPAAALVYASALTLTGDGDDPRTVLVGLTMMLLAIVALPVLMKFFTWTTGTATSGSGAGLAALTAGSAAAIHARAAMTGAPGTTAGGQAANLRHDLGPGGAQPSPPRNAPFQPAPSGAGSGASPSPAATTTAVSAAGAGVPGLVTSAAVVAGRSIFAVADTATQAATSHPGPAPAGESR